MFQGAGAPAHPPATKPAAPAPAGALPAGHPPMGAGAEGGEVVLGGEILLDSALGAVPKGVLYLIARAPAAPGQRGAPVLVKRIAPPNFPQAFTLTEGDRMMAGAELPAALTLEARLDQDGDAMTKSPGDVIGRLEGAAPGATDLKLTLNELIPGEPEAP